MGQNWVPKNNDIHAYITYIMIIYIYNIYIYIYNIYIYNIYIYNIYIQYIYMMFIYDAYIILKIYENLWSLLLKFWPPMVNFQQALQVLLQARVKLG